MGDSISLPPPTIFILETATTDTDALEDQFNKFYDKNEKVIEKSIQADIRSIALGKAASNTELLFQIEAFSETTKVVLDGLAGLGKVHPTIKSAVVAFHSVISLDFNFKRRDNDRKVAVVMLEMQSMMSAMFQLRHLKRTHIQEIERDADLDRLIESVTADIIQCGSDLNYYINQKLAVKLIKAKNFERCFKRHLENFARRRAELQLTISLYMAGGVDRASAANMSVSNKLNIVDAEADRIGESLRKLDTPQEEEVLQFVEQNNGAENCISKDKFLSQLLTIAGDVLPDSESESGLKPDERIERRRKVLTDGVDLDFEEALKRNTLRYERLLAIQKDHYERVIARLKKQEGGQEVTMSELDKLHDTVHSARATQGPPHNTRTQDPEHGQWISTALNEDLYRQHDRALTPEINRVDSPVRPGREGPSSASMFTNAHVGMIYGGTFINVVHIYQSDSPPAQGGATVSGSAVK